MSYFFQDGNFSLATIELSNGVHEKQLSLEEKCVLPLPIFFSIAIYFQGMIKFYHVGR